jgi:nitroimidazol reductase NimA-like FMN-containing flavoprotein (pyridoxamine 5'-phosphate oxidase superfamily)
MNKTEYETAASFWKDKESSAKKINSEELKAKIDTFLCTHTICALAAGSGRDIRCTPLEYSYFKGAVYILSEGGLKFKALEINKNVSLAVYDQSCGFGNLNSIQITGTAEIVGPDTEEYSSILTYKKIPLEAIRKLPHPMYMIKVIPSRFDMLCSDFKKTDMTCGSL